MSGINTTNKLGRVSKSLKKLKSNENSDFYQFEGIMGVDKGYFYNRSTYYLFNTSQFYQYQLVTGTLKNMYFEAEAVQYGGGAFNQMSLYISGDAADIYPFDGFGGDLQTIKGVWKLKNSWGSTRISGSNSILTYKAIIEFSKGAEFIPRYYVGTGSFKKL